MAERKCKWCQYLKSLYERDMEEELRQYIEHIPAEVRAPDEVYRERLEICSRCPDCISGMCRYCGCFVAARAAKWKLACPNPSEKKW